MKKYNKYKLKYLKLRNSTNGGASKGLPLLFNIVYDNGQLFYPMGQPFNKKYIPKIVKLQDNIK